MSVITLGERSTVKLLSLVGHAKHACRGTFKADLLATTLNSLWQEVCLSRGKQETVFMRARAGEDKQGRRGPPDL